MPAVVVNGPASWNTLVRLDALPQPRSQTLAARSVEHGLGGTAAGKAVTLAALGVDVLLSTVLGDDEPGTQVRTGLDRPGLRVLGRPAARGRTEQHLNLLAQNGDRVSIYLELPQVQGPTPSGLLAALREAPVAVLDLAEHSRPLLEAARASRVPVWCDVHDDDGAAEYPRAFAQVADVLLVSAARLDDPRRYLDARVVAGARLAVCTAGSAGALARDAEGWWEVPAVRVDVVDPEGAGDAFLAGLLAAHLDGLPTPDGLALASAVAALAVAQPGLGGGSVTRAQADALAGSVRVRRA
ncbi:carbohydrate kinase family protein [Cellulomonas sp. SG140]|uniref:carbohydrate kinase family protein n=1 Tax=Cellulomonas sp. SG140 TaxID=2976536 RepID=UPI0021E72641|nr:carbohydrate kinase family protein [Cellulomonas sp. SG140]